MATRDKERMMLEESRNKVEAYIYRIKNKLEDDEEIISKVTTDKQREELRKIATSAGEWLDDEGYSADLATMEDKYAEMSVPFEKVMLRVSELTDRPEAVKTLREELTKVEQLMSKWETERPHVTEEERASVLEKVEEARKWLSKQEDAQSKKKPHDEPAFLSSDVPKQMAPIEALVIKLGRKPKPKPPKKNETKAENETATGNETESSEEKTDEGAKPEEKDDSTTAEESKEEGESSEEIKEEEEL